MIQSLERTAPAPRRLRSSGYTVLRVRDGSFPLHRRTCAVAVLLPPFDVADARTRLRR